MSVSCSIGSFSVVPPALVDVEVRTNWTPANVIDSQDVTVKVKGDIIGPDPGAGLQAVKAAVLNQLRESGLSLVAGGFNLNLQPSGCFQGPFALSFETESDEGAADGHWIYSLTVFAKVKGTHATPVYELDTSIQVRKINGKAVRKIWTATCQASSTATAFDTIDGFTPDAKPLEETIKRDPAKCRVTATWVWDLARATWIEETVEMPEKGTLWGADGQIGDPEGEAKDPILFEKPNEAILIHIHGLVKSYDPDLIEIPRPHLQESDNCHRQWALERRNSQKPQVRNVVEQIWEQPYEEIWLVSGKAPDLDHGDHSSESYVQTPEPADGSIANDKN